MKYCENCRTAVNDKEENCPRCGGPLQIVPGMEKPQREAAAPVATADMDRLLSRGLWALEHEENDRDFLAAWKRIPKNDVKAANELISRLSDPAPKIRVRAARALGYMTSPQATKPLITALADQDPKVRGFSAFSLGLRGNKETFVQLISAMDDKDAFVREKVVQALSMFKDPKVMKIIQEALKDPEASVRKMAIQALAPSEDKEIYKLVMQGITDKDPNVRIYTIWNLSHGGAIRALMPLGKLLEKDGNPAVRANAARAVGFIKDQKSIKPLVSALADSEPRVRGDAAAALGMLASTPGLTQPVGKIASKPLAGLLDDPVETVRWRTINVLGLMLQDQDSAPKIIKALRADSPKVKATAAWALAHIPGSQAAEALIAALDDKNESVRETAAWALGIRREASAVAKLVSMLASAPVNIIKRAARSLGLIGDANATVPVAKAIQNAEDPALVGDLRSALRSFRRKMK